MLLSYGFCGGKVLSCSPKTLPQMAVGWEGGEENISVQGKGKN